MLEAFKQKASPALYFASKAKKTITKAAKFEIDVVRGRETYAVDIVMGGGSRSNDKSRFTTKEYTPLFYNESYEITAMELQNRIPGMTVYQAASMDYSDDLVALITDKQQCIQDKIVRAIELQARDALFDGQISPIGQKDTTIDFKKKTAHNVAPSKKWSASDGVPLTDIQAGADLCRENGLVDDMTFELTVADNVVEVLLANAQFSDKANLRHIQNVDMGMPRPEKKGATFHGYFSAGPYTIELWSYPQRYEIPEGFGLDDEGTKAPYIPNGKAILMPKNGIRFDLVYGGVPVVSNQVDPSLAALGLNGSLGIAEADFLPYAYLDFRKECISAGIKSNPLFIPHQIDGFMTFNNLV
jgi:hypothetical protein